GVAALDPRDQARTPGLGRVALAGEPRTGEVVLQCRRAPFLVAGRRLPGVDARVADQRAQQLGRLGLDPRLVVHRESPWSFGLATWPRGWSPRAGLRSR